MSKLNGSFKQKKIYFSQVSNHALRDKNLSLKAKGLYALIQSYVTIENFVLYKATLKAQCYEGNTSFESTWKELKEKGYLLQDKFKDEEGKFVYVYELLDCPCEDKNHTPKTEGVDNPPSGQVGIYNNTDIINTDLSNTNYLLNTKVLRISTLHNLSDCEEADSLIDLYEISIDDEYLLYYLKLMFTYGLKHKRMRKSNYSYVQRCLNALRGNNISLEEWKEVVEDHIANLPRKNDGDILAFFEASKRYFEVDLRDEVNRYY